MEEIYTAIARASQPFTLPSPWHTVPCDPAFISLPTDKPAFLAELQLQFSNEQLIEAGVAIKDAEGNVALTPTLAADREPIWAIRHLPDQVTALIVQMHTLGIQQQWALVTALADLRQGELITSAGDQLVVAYTMQDLAILRSVGIAAVPGGNWRRLSKPQWIYLCQALRATRTAQEPITLTLANWSLAAMDRADVLPATTSWSHLVDLYQYLDLSFDSFGLWKPNETHLKQLGFQLQYQDIQHVRAGLLHGIAQDSTAIDAGLGPLRPEPTTFVEAYRSWRRADRDTVNPVARQKAYEQLCELLDRQRFDPLVEEAMRATSPLERNAEIALAETSRLLQPQVLMLTERIRRNVGEKGTRAGASITKEELDQVLALTDRLMALTQGVQECRRNRPAKLVKLSMPSAGRSKPSASIRKKSPR